MHHFKPYWYALNTWSEQDEGAMEEFPYQPVLQDGGISHTLSSWFKSEGECVDFIEEVVLGATLEEKE